MDARVEVVLGGACLLCPKNSRGRAWSWHEPWKAVVFQWHLPWLVAVGGFVAFVFLSHRYGGMIL